MVRTGPSMDSNQGVMCQAPLSGHGGMPDLESDDGLKWEEFFGTSVDISSTLLDMFDTLAAKNSAQPERSKVEGPFYPLIVGSSSPSDPGGTGSTDSDRQRKPGFREREAMQGNRRPVRGYNRTGRSYSEAAFQEKKRPLSTSSISSSSSSSSSSLPRNGLEVKRSYLASIESLDDDIVSEDNCPVRTVGNREGANAHQVPTSNGKLRWCDPNLSHVDRVVLEIVETERTYVRDLNEIIQDYLKHISNAHHSKVSNGSLKELFSNIEDIHNFNSYVVQELEECGLNPVAVARCFVKNSDGFEVYTQYCTNYPRTVSVLTELMGSMETAEIFKERQMALQHNLPLGSYLLKPVQRILKYHLLLQNLVKHCDKELEGYLDIKNALSVMTGIAYHINDMKRKHEHAVRVQEIQSLLYGWEGEDLTTYGELVAEGAFRMYRAKALRHLFLFDKMLLIAKKKEEGILSYKTHIMCSNLMLIESIQGEPLCFHVIPFDNPRHQYTFQARNVDQKREWCLQLKQVILENYNAVIPSHARQLVMELGQSKQDSGSLEKSTAKKQLHAPEYLQKRKQERRKSEINANRASTKSKKGLKKNEIIQNGKSYFVGRRKSPSMDAKSNDNISISSRESWASQPDNFSWTKSQNDVNNSSNHRTRSFSSSKESVSECHSPSGPASFSRDCKLRHSLPEPSLSHRSAYKGFRHVWRTWKSVPEETTDTENDDILDNVDVKRVPALRPSSRPFRNRTYRENVDLSGEYVTFFAAHKYACRDLPADNIDPSAVESEPDSQRFREELESANLTASNPSLSKRENPRKQKTQDKLKKSAEKYICDDSTHSMWVKSKGSRSKDHDPESANSGYSWRQSAAIRRVQSFTGMAKAKVANLHHNFSFRNHSHACGNSKLILKCSELPVGGPSLPSNMEGISPTTPAAWLQNQEEHLANSDKKSGSLPRSFQLSTEMTDSVSESIHYCHPESDNSPRTRVRMDSHRNAHTEHRPFTIAAEKPSEADFLGGMNDYVELSPCQSTNEHFLSHKDSFDLDTTTGCTNTPAVSMENVHFIHPEHKIYHQAASKYSTLKHVISNMGSKIAGLKATLTNPLNQDHTDSCSNISVDSDYIRNDAGQCSSQTSLRSNNEISPKIFSSKFAHSVAKAYSSVVKPKLKKADSKCGKKAFDGGKQERSPVYKSESSIIGARMAHPLESEYSVPKNFLNNLKRGMELETQKSINNVTSSYSGKQENSFKHEEGEDTASDASESSADSYYERTFDAIENALAEDMFRDSAIYSDPEDADFSAVESPLTFIGQHNNVKNNYMSRFENGDSCSLSPTSPQLELTCRKGVNQAIIHRLKILEENIKYQSEDVSLSFEIPQTLYQQKEEAEKWCLGDYEESETSSEHSASTVNTVMELGNSVPKSLANLNKTRTQPRIKGWVKHVVDKLQGENHV